MYNNYYGFREKPFSLTPDPHFLYLSSVHKRALAYLTYGLYDKKGFIVITGEIGAGKTTIIQALLKRLNADTMVARVINTKVSSIQLLKMIMRDFGIETEGEGKEDLLYKLNRFLLKEYALGHNVVIIIDEAQNLEPTTLEEIRLLSNLETEKDKLLQIILVGQPELREILSMQGLRQLRQRITVGYHISSLTSKEVTGYIRHRLAVAGIENNEIFTSLAIKEVYKASRGIPRLINIICDAALVTGYVKERKKISDKLVKGVIKELKSDIIRLYPESSEQKEAAVVHGKVLASAPASANMSGVSPTDIAQNELYSKYKSHIEWEKRLKNKQHELENRQGEIYDKLKQLLDMERELITREKRIKNKEVELGLSVRRKRI